MVRYLTDAAAYDEIPATDDRDVAELIPAAVDEVLTLAEGWLGWNGRTSIGDGNVWTPHKALRRVTDHLVDHLAELEARLAGLPTIPDRWHGRRLTLDSDWARFTEADLDEATSRLRRLALCYRARLAGLDAETLDAETLNRPSANGAWTLRQVVHHVANVTFYAHQMDDPLDSNG
jgi:hypothetical protein